MSTLKVNKIKFSQLHVFQKLISVRKLKKESRGILLSDIFQEFSRKCFPTSPIKNQKNVTKHVWKKTTPSHQKKKKKSIITSKCMKSHTSAYPHNICNALHLQGTNTWACATRLLFSSSEVFPMGPLTPQPWPGLPLAQLGVGTGWCIYIGSLDQTTESQDWHHHCTKSVICLLYVQTTARCSGEQMTCDGMQAALYPTLQKSWVQHKTTPGQPSVSKLSITHSVWAQLKNGPNDTNIESIEIQTPAALKYKFPHKYLEHFYLCTCTAVDNLEQ